MNAPRVPVGIPHSHPSSPPALPRRRLAGLPVLVLAWLCLPALGQYVEDWNSPDSTNCWFYMDRGLVSPGSEEESIPWFPDRGVGDSPFVACRLDQVAHWPPTGAEMFYPLHTYGAKSCPGYQPVNFLVNTQVVVHLNRLPIPHLKLPGATQPAAIDGRMRLWVGQWDDERRFAFYYYAHRLVVPWCTNWVPTSVVLINQPDNWTLFAAAGDPIPVGEILAAPQQWGFGLEIEPGPGPGTPPLKNWLGFDNLSVTAGSCPPKTTWTVHPDPAFGADFLSINEALGSPCVQSAHTVRVWGGHTYNEVVFSARALKFHGVAVEGHRPLLTAPLPLVGLAPTHFTLEKGGEFLDFELHGTNLSAGPLPDFNGVAIMGPTLVSNCVISGYTGTGFLGFCAANPNDIPSLVIASHLVGNGVGVANGDVEHVYRYNTIAENGLGAYTVTGSQARFLDNLIVNNTTQGIEIWQYGVFPHNQTEVANNLIAGNGGHGVLLTYAHPAHPNAATIRDNLIAGNGGYAIHAVDHSDTRAPRLWALGAACPSGTLTDDSGKAWLVGGVNPRIDHDCFWQNNGGATNLAGQFYSTNLTVGGRAHTYYTVPHGGRFLFTGCFAADPMLKPDLRIDPESPCVNAGSQHLDPGVTQSDGRRDRGWLDIGCHFPAFLNPTLVVRSVTGNQVVIRAENLQRGGESELIFVVEPTWSTPFGSLDIVISPQDLAPRRSGFFWLR